MNRAADIAEELNNLSPLLAGVSPVPVQAVPEGYFETLEAQVMAAVLAGTREGAGEVPEGYFNGLPQQILAKIAGTAAHELQALSPLLAALPKTVPFAVPEGYFEAGGPAENAEPELSENLAAARHQPVFAVPDGYFDQLPDQLLQRVRPAGSARVIRMRVLRYAVAAVFTALLALGGYQWLQQPAGPAQPVVAVQPRLPAFIEEGTKLDDQQFNEKLSKLEEEVIIRYLEKTSAESDVAVLSASLDDSAVPDEEAYLTDENTLNQFIETLSTDN